MRDSFFTQTKREDKEQYISNNILEGNGTETNLLNPLGIFRTKDSIANEKSCTF